MFAIDLHLHRPIHHVDLHIHDLCVLVPCDESSNNYLTHASNKSYTIAH
jgi:hypothetical protein